MSVLTQPILNVIAEAIANARAVVPGLVREVTGADNGERIVTLEPGIGRRQAGVEVADGPVPGCPVLYPSGAGWSVVWPVDAGDEVLGLACDRNSERWKANLDPGQAHSLERSHDVSDSLLLPFASSPANAPSDPGTDMVISNEHGEVMRLGLGTVTISTPGPDPTVVATITLTASGDIELATTATSKVIAGIGGAAEALTKVNKLLDVLTTASNAAISAAGLIVPPAGDSGGAAFAAFLATLQASMVSLAGTLNLDAS